MSRVPAWLLSLSLLGACGGSAPAASTSGEGIEERATTGNACLASYARQRDLTVVGRVVEQGLLMAAVPGDGWTVDCSGGQPALLTATNRATSRILTFTVDAGIIGPVDVAAYANEHVAHSRETYASNGYEDMVAADPFVAEDMYVVATHATGEHAPFAQLSVYRVIPSADGLFRLHLSEIGQDGRLLQAHGEQLLRSAATFLLEAPEEGER